MQARKILFGFTLFISLVLEFYVRHFDMWEKWPFIDSVMHFFWGFNIFLLIVVFFHWKVKDALLLGIVWQIYWESIEILGDFIIPQAEYLLDHFFYDGIKDTILNFFGSLVAFNIIRLLPGKNREIDTKGFKLWMIIFILDIIPLIVLGVLLDFSGSKGDIITVYWTIISTIVSFIILLIISILKRKKVYLVM